LAACSLAHLDHGQEPAVEAQNVDLAPSAADIAGENGNAPSGEITDGQLFGRRAAPLAHVR
jgi:hypothetical protein